MYTLRIVADETDGTQAFTFHGCSAAELLQQYSDKAANNQAELWQDGRLLGILKCLEYNLWQVNGSPIVACRSDLALRKDEDLKSQAGMFGPA